MNVQPFEKISANIDVIRYLFELLTFEDQLNLANVTNELQYIFKNFIWKQTYKRIEITKCHDDNKCQINNCQCKVIIANETYTNNKLVAAKNLNAFLKIYYHDIEELTEKRGTALDLNSFQNLTCINYYDMKITNHHLQLIANNCQKLKQLNIYYCQNENNNYLIKIGQDLELNTLAQMKSLTHLIIHNFNLYQLKYEELLNILACTRLKYLNLNVVNITDDDSVNIAKMDLSNTLQELVITGSFASNHWSTSSNIFLKNFENLKSLTVRLVESAGQAVIETLAKTCKHLKILNFHRTTFKEIQQISLLDNLTELTFNVCRGLTHENLKDILTKMKLLKFSSTETEYEGIFLNYSLPPSIECLNIDNISTAQFEVLPHNVIKQLNWYGDDYDISSMCPHIEVLEIVRGYLSTDHLLQLKSLNKITLPPRITLPYLVALLKHSTLSHIHLSGYYPLYSISKDLPEKLLDIDNINIKSIAIPLNVFKYDYSIWFNLVHRNRKLQLICFSSYGRAFYIDFLPNLINHLNFPRQIKSFLFAGFKVDCNELRRNCIEYMDEIFLNFNSMPGGEYKNRLIFQYD